MSQKGFTTTIILLIALGVLGLSFGFWLYITNKIPGHPGYIALPVAPSSSSPKPISIQQNQTANWETYRSEKYDFEIKYPPDWKITEETDFIGFRSPEWDKEPKLDGPTVTVSVWKNISKEEALSNSAFETKEEVNREGDAPLGEFGNEKYLVRGSSAGAATPAKETIINGYSAIMAEMPTRLYGAEGYTGTSEGKQVLIMGNNMYAYIRIETSFYEVFDKMISTFKFVK